MNVILVVSDTMRRDHLGAYGNDWIHTPDLDQLAQQSYVFENAYTASFPTVENRCDIMTGRYTFIEFGWGPLPTDYTVMAEVLNEADYTTMLIADTPHPFRYGYHFQRGFGGYSLIRGQENDLWRTAPADPPLPCSPDKLREPYATVKQYLRNVAVRRREEDYFVAQTMRQAAAWLEENHNQDFFLYVDTFDPHEPWDPPQWYVDLYDPGYEGEEVIYPRYYFTDYLTDRELQHCRALYAGEVSLVDTWVGYLLERVETLGLADNTTIIFTADHGYLHGEHGIIGKAIRSEDWHGWCPLWEEIAHIPLMIRLPGQTQGERIAALVQPPDIMPTIIDLMDAENPRTMHGTSLRSIMQGDIQQIRPIAITSPSLAHDPNAGIPTTISDGEWSLIYSGSPDAPRVSHHTKAVDNISLSLRALEEMAEEPILYHLPSDPGQQKNVIDENQAVAERLHRACVELLEQVGMEEAYLRHRRHLQHNVVPKLLTSTPISIYIVPNNTVVSQAGRTSPMRNTMHYLLMSLLALLVVTCAASAEPLDEAIQQTGEDFKILKESVDQATEKLDQVGDGLYKAEQFVRNATNIDAPTKRQLLEKIEEAKNSLGTYTEPLKTFSKYAGPAVSAFDVYNEIKDLKAKAAARQGGPLAGQLQVVATLMEKYGGKVPILGSAIEAYGKITTGILDATDRLAQTVDQNRNQGAVGGQGYYATGASKELYDKMVEQFGQDFAQTTRFVPGSPPWVYEPAFDQGPTLIWDSDSKEWYKIDSGAPVGDIFKMNLLAGRRREPWELKALSEHWDSGQQRLQTADDIKDMFGRLRNLLLGPAADAFYKVNQKYDYDLSWWAEHPQEFRAKYAYDAAFKRRINQALGDLYSEFNQQGADDSAKALEKWAQDHGVSLPQPEEPPADQPPTDQPPADQPPADQPPADQPPGQQPPPGPVSLSICFLVDCSGSMSGSKIASAKAAVKSSITQTNDGKTEWAVLGFGGCQCWEECGFTQGAGVAAAAVDGLGTGGDTPLTYSTYKALSYLSKNGHGQTGRLIVLCDGQDNCPERGSTSQPEAMAGLKTIVKTRSLPQPPGGNP